MKHSELRDSYQDYGKENMGLSSLSVVELGAQLEQALEDMTEETYDESVVEAYMKALEEKSPMPDMPDTATAYASFLHRLGEAEEASLHRPRRKVVRFRMAFVAVLAVAALLGGMVLAQAAGMDLFGAIARWTDETFHFESAQEGGDRDSSDLGWKGSAGVTVGDSVQGEIIPADSVQEVLDQFCITEVTAPSWIPQGYTLKEVSVLAEEPYMFVLAATYVHPEKRMISFVLATHFNTSFATVEKSPGEVETWTQQGTTYYLMEDMKNYTIAWTTEHFECYLGGPEKEILESMIDTAK